MGNAEAVGIKLNPLRTGRDHFARASIYHRSLEFLKKSEKYGEYQHYETQLIDYAHLVVAVDRSVPQPTGYKFPEIGASVPDLARGFVQWCNLDYEIIQTYRDAITASMPPVANTDTAPGQAEPETDDEKNA